MRIVQSDDGERKGGRVQLLAVRDLRPDVERRATTIVEFLWRTKGVDMSTSMAAADWIKRIADDERKRDTVRVREDELAARKADLVRRNGRLLIDEPRATVSRDVDAFRDEFVETPRATWSWKPPPDGGFVVRKPHRRRSPSRLRQIWRQPPWSATIVSPRRTVFRRVRIAST